MHVSATGGRCGRPLSGSIAVLALSALLAAPAAGQSAAFQTLAVKTPLRDVPASADGPVHFSRAGVTREANLQNSRTLLHFLSATEPAADDVLPVMGRNFGLVAVGIIVPPFLFRPNTWFVRAAPSISATDLAELAVVVVGPGGATPRVMRLSPAGSTSTFSYPPSVNYESGVVAWASQYHADLNTYPTASDWRVLVVDHTDPGVDLNALTYTPPASIPSTCPALLTENSLDGAAIVVALRDGAFETGVTAADFELVTTIPGVTINSVSSGDTWATLTLASTAELSAAADLAVRVLASAHSGGTALTTWPVNVAPGDGALASLPDPGLRRAVARALGKAPGSVTEVDLCKLTSLNADGFGVASLAGVEATWNLGWLTLSGNAPEAGGEPLDLSPLVGLPSLTHLDLSDTGLVDVSDPSRLTGLRTLLLGGNAVRDLSPLSGLTGLEALTLSGNGLAAGSALATLSSLESLEQLWLDGNDLSDISALAGLNSLIYLHLGDNRIADISPLAGLSKLRRLWLPGNMLADVSALAGLRELRRLDLSRNRIADASPLRGLPRLSWLRLGWNRLAEVSRLAGHPRLADGGALGLRGNPLGAAALATHIPALREAGGVVVFGWDVPLFPAASDTSGRSGVVRVLNRSDMDGMVLVEAVDEAGQMFGPATLSLAAGAAASFDSADLENGNAEMGLAEGIGPPTQGNWRLLLWSVLDIEVLAYMRTPDGFLTATHSELPRTGDSLSAFLFNPASNRMQRSSLRVFNPGAEPARMSVWGVDDAGRGRFASGFMAPPNAPLVLRAGQLERSRSAAGAGLGNGVGKWRLRVAAPWPLAASTFLESPSGHLSNLSPPPLRTAADEMLRLPLFPSASNPSGREGFARVANMTAAEGVVDIEAVDDAGVRAGPVRLRLAARATTHFNSEDLENGNAAKGLASGVGAPTKGMWRLELQSSTLPLAAATYARHADGFVTSLHETAPAAKGSARVAVFHPASTNGQRSLLRLANNGDEPAMATITGVDDAGAAADPLTVTVPAGEALTLTATQLEDGDEGLEGALGDGDGQWRLTVAFDNPLTVMSLLESPAGHLSNLSATARP